MLEQKEEGLVSPDAGSRDGAGPHGGRSSPAGSPAAEGALIGTFAGDALGAAWEGSAPLRRRDASDRVVSSLLDAPLRYTDDTQLTLALAEHLLEAPEVDPQRLADRILERVEPWRGYGVGMLRLVDHWRLRVPVTEAATAVFPEGSFGNGAAMRVAPVGVLWAHDPRRLDEVARRQARVTHAHPLGQDGAAVQAAAVGLAATRGRFGESELADLVDVPTSEELRGGVRAAAQQVEAWRGDEALTLAEVAATLGNEVVAQRSVPAALWAAAAARDLPDGIQLALGLGGDADTIAAMAGAILGAAGGRAAIPLDWQRALEDGPYGRTFSIDLARRLSRVATGP